MLHPAHFRKFVIIPALAKLPEPMRSPAAIELLFGTALKESGLTYLKQGLKRPSDGRARALGLYQMEPATHRDLSRYLTTQPALLPIIAPQGLRRATDLITDLVYATHMARLRYWIVPEPLPDAGDVLGLARAWSYWYNTRRDPQEQAEWVALYQRFA